MKVLVPYAHPAQQHSRVNKALAAVAKNVSDVSIVDLYATYPRLDLYVDVEQQRLLDHPPYVVFDTANYQRMARSRSGIRVRL